MNDKSKKLIFKALFGAAAIIMFFRGLEAGKILFGHDAINIYLPFWIKAKEMLHSGQLPLWLDSIYCGMPFLSSSSLIFLYPTDFIFALLNLAPESLYVPDIIIHIFLAALGTYLFLRRRGIGFEAAVLGSAFAAFSGYIISYILPGHWNNIKAGSLIPLVFYFTDRAAREKSLLHVLNCGLISGLQILATGMQIMAYTFMAASAYAVFIVLSERADIKEKIKHLSFILAAAVAAVFASAPQFIPSFDYKDESWRGGFTYESFISWSFHPLETLTFLFPNLYGMHSEKYFGYMPMCLTTYFMGSIPFLLLFFLPLKERKKEVVFLSALAGFFLILSFGGHTPLYSLFYNIPVLNQFRNPSRFLYVFSFITAVLAAYSLDNLFKNGVNLKPRLKYFAVFSGAAALAALIAAVSFSSLAPALAKAAGKAAPKAASLGTDTLFFIISVSAVCLVSYLAVKKGNKAVFAAALILFAVHFADTYRVNREFIKFYDFSAVVPSKNTAYEEIKKDKSVYRVFDTRRAALPNAGVYYGFESLTGLHGLIPSRYMRLSNAGAFNNINVNRQLNVKYYLFDNEISIPGLERIFAQQGVFVYADSQALGRAYMAQSVSKVSSEEALSRMASGTMAPYHALIEAGPDIISSGGVTDYVEKTGRGLKAGVQSNGEGLCVVSIPNFKGMKARVNGKESEVLTVNFIQSGVKTGSGKNEIEFYYRERGLTAGFILFVIFSGLYAAAFFREKKGANAKPR